MFFLGLFLPDSRLTVESPDVMLYTVFDGLDVLIILELTPSAMQCFPLGVEPNTPCFELDPPASHHVVCLRSLGLSAI